MSLMLASSSFAEEPASGSNEARENAAGPSPSVVQVVSTETGFELRRNGEPYFIRGAGAHESHVDEIVAAGGNSIRTWHARHTRQALDRASELGLSVCVGIWLAHESQGFNYSDEARVAELVSRSRVVAEQLKDHPAVLMWGIGNEMEGSGKNPAIWQAVNRIARAIKEVDPNHPTITVIAGAGRDKLRQFDTHCPDVDIVGINAYGDLSRIPVAVKRQELTRPYVITEFGPYGWWQVGKTSWGAELEPTSTAKAQTYMDSYEATVSSQTGKCLGSYAFLWGHKQEHTHTWFGMFLPTGERTASVDAMTKAWTGNWPANRCPTVLGLTVEPAAPSGELAKKESKTEDAEGESPAEHIYAPGTVLICRAQAKDPEGKPLTAKWELRPESTDKRSGGFREEVPPVIAEAIVSVEDLTAHVRLPETAKAYRIFVTILDDRNQAATANVPVLVREKKADAP